MLISQRGEQDSAGPVISACMSAVLSVPVELHTQPCVYAYVHVYGEYMCPYWEYTLSLATGWTWSCGSCGSLAAIRLLDLAAPNRMYIIFRLVFCLLMPSK